MTEAEYRAKRRDIIERYMDEIDSHESAGEYGDAENARRWLYRKLEDLKRERDGR